jgi:uncharacterized membrane protein YidH (DUF202 family)
MDSPFLLFAHSLFRYLVLLAVAYAGFVALAGYLRKRPIRHMHRSMAIVAVVLCHLQLALGLVLYLSRFKAYGTAGHIGIYWKYEHIGMMVIGIALVTAGRALARRAKYERAKQLRVAAFYLSALLIFLLSTPWPFTEAGHGRGWL